MIGAIVLIGSVIAMRPFIRRDYVDVAEMSRACMKNLGVAELSMLNV